MGRHREIVDGREVKTPAESHCDGCPGGWYRSAFVFSVSRYERLMFDGGFSNNVLLDRCSDPLVLEATRYIETERLRRKNYWDSK